MASIISLLSFQRGAGKSVIAANVGSLLALAGRRVGIVDADLLSPSLPTLFGLDGTIVGRSLNDYLWGRCDIEQTAHDVTLLLGPVVAGRLFLVPASPYSATMAGMTPKDFDIERFSEGFGDLIEALGLDVLIVDTHAGLHPESLTLMAISDVVAIVFRYDQRGFQGTGVMIDVARNIGLPEVMLIGNQVLKIFDIAEVQAGIERAFNCPVDIILPHSQDLMALGNTDIFALHYPDHPTTGAFKQIAAALSARSGA